MSSQPFVAEAENILLSPLTRAQESSSSARLGKWPLRARNRVATIFKQTHADEQQQEANNPGISAAAEAVSLLKARGFVSTSPARTY